MKWLVGAVIALLCGTIAVTTIGGLVADDESATPSFTAPRPTTPPVPSAPSGTPPTTAAPGGSVSPTSTTAGTATFSLTEIAQHASAASCWLLVSGAVYDVTEYLRRHPGGGGLVTPWCGKEATLAFATEDGRGEHSPRAYALLADYYIGDRG
jgi:hypothetical protein